MTTRLDPISTIRPMIQIRILPMILLILGSVVAAEETDERSSSTPLATAEQQEIKIFLRISKELFEELTRNVVEMTMPVRECVEGMPPQRAGKR